MKKYSLPLVFSIIFLLCSCVVTQDIGFDASGPLSGNAGTDIDVHDFFVGVVQDLSSWQDTGNNDPVTDVAISDFERNLASSRHSSNVSFYRDAENSYVGSFTFSDFEGLVSDLCAQNPEQDLVTVSRSSGRTRVQLRISLDNWDSLTQVVPFLAERNFAVWGPVYNNPPYDYLTAEDYKDLVGFILGEDGPEAIDNSSITIVLRTPAAVKGTNGTRTAPDTVSFTFPLIDFLLLHDPVLFWCEF